MAKKFFEVFQNLTLKGHLKDLFESVLVDRVTATKKKDFLRIYIESDNLIEKDLVYQVEEAIKKQLFPTANMEVKLYEKFFLSKQYTPKRLMELYRESILLELKEYSNVEYMLFKRAEILYPSEKEIQLKVKESAFTELKMTELIRVLDKIFQERCQLSVFFSVAYEEAKEEEINDDADQIIHRKVAEIVERSKQALQLDDDFEGIKETIGKESDSKDNGEITGKSNTEKPVSKQESNKSDGAAPKKEFKFQKRQKASDDPNVIYGRDFEDELIPIEEIQGEMGEVTIKGKILAVDKKTIRNDKCIVIFQLSDFTDTITVKIFCREDQMETVEGSIKPGAFVKVKGVTMFDKFDSDLIISSVIGIRKITDFTVSRMDHGSKKRVELHCHTKMSDMDGVSDTKDIIKRAYKYGHPAIAITDHGNVQAFPDAYHAWEDLWKAEKNKRKEAGEEAPNKNDFFKVI